MLTDSQIKAAAATSTSYAKGQAYYLGGHVRKVNFCSDDNSFAAKILGRELYTTYVKLDERHSIEHFECECPAFFGYNGACKHIIALLKIIQRDWTKYFGADAALALPLTRATEELLTFFHQQSYEPARVSSKEIIKIIPTYAFNSSRYDPANVLDFVIGTDRMYVLKHIPQLLDALENNDEIIFGKKFTLKPPTAVFDDLSNTLLTIIRQAYTEEKQRLAWGYSSASSSAFAEPRYFRLTNSNLLRFFDAMGDQPFQAAINYDSLHTVTIKNSRPPVKLGVKAIDGGLRLTMDLDDNELYSLDSDCHYLYYDKTIYHVDSLFARYIKPLLKCFHDNKNHEALIPASAVSDFVTTALPTIETIATVDVDNTVYNRFYKRPLEKHVYLDKYGAGMSARIEFHYGDVIINPIVVTDVEHEELKGRWLLRSTTEENHLLEIFRQYGFNQTVDQLVLDDEEATYDFLDQALPELRNIAEIFYADNFKYPKIRQPGKIAGGVRLNTNSDMLEFSLFYQDMSPKELMALLAAYKLKKRYHRLEDGTFISLDGAEFQTAAQLIDQLGMRPGDIEKQVVELPKYRALYLDSLARETDDFSIERNSAFKKMVQDIREPQDIEYSLPSGLHGKLRDYQKTGFKWLKSLASYGLGGVLADDMGLGKTLQVLTFILSEKEQDPTPSLVVAPTSLVYNWQDEALKFAPGLKVAVISGQQSARLEQLSAIDQADLVVTSYALIKRDIELYENRNFKYCFLDEAQHVKNPNTLNAQSVKKINAKSYFALTGTPIENTLTELWSIFDFVLPGYLGTHKSFSKRFEVPIVKNDDKQALRELSRHIKPFILRRMKKTVLKELPEKIESKMTNEMTDEQTKLYQAWLLQAKAELDNEIEANGFAKSQIKILSLLTRLRQICCHPSLFIDNYQGGSGKLDMLQEIVKDAISGGHRILLFSQFTGMLNLIKQELDAQGFSYHYLDGSTKAEDRMKLVHSFNSGDKAIFLISLKAGGTGLNLTGADMVIHYDPWWNPAVEDQATDRAYRIGQKNSVQVYKLITKNTIEEKIYTLQQKKKEMIDTLIEPGENFLTKLSETEIRELFTL